MLFFINFIYINVSVNVNVLNSGVKNEDVKNVFKSVLKDFSKILN